jgi:hypothetical protein
VAETQLQSLSSSSIRKVFVSNKTQSRCFALFLYINCTDGLLRTSGARDKSERSLTLDPRCCTIGFGSARPIRRVVIGQPDRPLRSLTSDRRGYSGPRSGRRHVTVGGLSKDLIRRPKSKNAMERTRAAIAIAILVGTTQPAAAGTYTLSFDSLAPMVGQVVSSVTEDGFTIVGDSGFGFVVVQTPNGVFPQYVSLAPLGNWTVTDNTSEPIYSSSQSAISIVLGGPLTDQPYDLQVTGTLNGVTQWQDTLAGEIQLSPATAALTPGLPPVDSIFVHSTLPGQPYQITDLVIQTAVPEPPSIALASTGLALLGCYAIRSRCGWCTKTDRSSPAITCGNLPSRRRRIFRARESLI